MGSELVSDLPSQFWGGAIGIASPSYSELFYEHLPFYLSIGMSPGQYWDEDNTLTKYYRKAHELKRQRLNQALWMMGLYVYEAVSDVSPILHDFAKKGTKARPYVSEPFPLTSREVREREEREERKRYEAQRAQVAAWAKRANAKIRSKGGSG